MSEQRSSKDQFSCCTLEDVMPTLPWHAREVVTAEIERLRTALRGIQSCSTCEACRGAATLALGGGNACIGNCGASVPGPNAYCEACFLKARRPAHEREPPHCSTCGCGLAPELRADLQAAAFDLIDVLDAALIGAPDTGLRVRAENYLPVMAAIKRVRSITEAASSQPPRDGQ